MLQHEVVSDLWNLYKSRGNTDDGATDDTVNALMALGMGHWQARVRALCAQTEAVKAQQA